MKIYTMRLLTIGVAAFVAAACGGGGGGGGSPTTPGGGGGGSGSVAVTISIDASGTVNPNDVRIEVGQSVRMTNNHSRAHEIKSNPHDMHTDCPPINAFDRQNPAGSAVLGPFTQRGTCQYHDHMDPSNRALWGQIRVGVDEPGPPPNYIRP